MIPPPDKSILFLSYWYAPMQGMGVHRVLSACSRYQKKGFKVHVLTSRNRRLVKQDKYVDQHIETVEVYAFDFRFWHAFLNKRNINGQSNTVKVKGWYPWFVKCSQSFPFDMVFGEGGFTYIINAVLKASRLVREKKITHIYSSYSPMADHWIAAILKYLHPGLFWIADFRDQHVDIFRKNTLLPAWQLWMDRRIMRKADLITTVSHGMTSQLAYLGMPVSVVYNDHRVDHPDTLGTERQNKFKVTYTGSLYPWQPLDEFLSIVQKLDLVFPDHIELIYAGRDSVVWDNGLMAHDLIKLSRNEGLVSHKRALKLQKEADLNILLTWNHSGSRGVLTGKVFEYIRSERPLLALINGNKDQELVDLIDQGDMPSLVHSIDGGIEDVNGFIRRLIVQKMENVENSIEAVWS